MPFGRQYTAREPPSCMYEMQIFKHPITKDRKDTMRTIQRLVLSLLLVVSLSSLSFGKTDEFGTLKPNQKIASFKTEAVYENEIGTVIGARFRHIPSDFVLDLLRIQSVPQGFMWVNSPPPTDQGEPHTLEHLLLGKGTHGRYVASLEDMSLGQSSAFTEQVRTCYHFHTSASNDAFFNLFEAKLDAMLNPNFSDEEIRREVCNMGIISGDDGSLRLEEKGTVYNEMVSSFERRWGNLYFTLGRLMYGMDHPLSYSAGGFPAAIRTMTPADIRNFHSSTHHLNNMGAAVSIGDDISLADCLTKLSDICGRVEPKAKKGLDPASLYDRLPKINPLTVGTIQLENFPSNNPDDPGLLVYAWPATQKFNNNENYFMQLLLENLSSGETSNLHRLFVNSQTRIIDIGASSVFGWLDQGPGYPAYIGFDDVKRESLTETMIDSVRGLVLSEVTRIAALPDTSAELKAFNERAKNRVVERRRYLRMFLNSPPGWGSRGVGSEWIELVQRLHRLGGFKRSLTLNPELAFADSLLALDGNIWSSYITKWRLVADKPYGVGTRPDPQMITTSESERVERGNTYADKLMADYGVESREAAIVRYKEDYDKNTALIDEEGKKIQMPGFIKNPPLGIDDNLRYTVDTLPGGGSMVVSTFDNITSGTFALAFNMDVVPESLLVYAAALPTFISQVGAIRDGQAISYEQFIESIRKEILGLNTYYSVNYRTGRSELVVRAAGSNREESKKALGWLATSLFDPDLRAENLPRIGDAIQLGLSNHRSRTQGSEESWVNNPAEAYWKQTNPLLLATDCFFTRAHAFQRLRWLLRDVASPETGKEFTGVMLALSTAGSTMGRDSLSALLDQLSLGDKSTSTSPVISRYKAVSGETKTLVNDAVEDLRQSIADVPDATLSRDWEYLCKQITADSRVSPRDALASIQHVLDLVRRADNVRAFVIANSEDQKTLVPELEAIVKRLNTEPSTHQTYSQESHVINRMHQHSTGTGKPLFVGLVENGTRSGVHINTADCAGFWDSDPEKLLTFLSARLYGGGGAHSMFMQTWGAGLAYSNGLRSNETNGRLMYYGERCPDLAQTMQFVVSTLKNAPYDSSLADYSVSQAFAVMRSGSSYEARGEEMADDLADGITPDVVSRFRRGILDLRSQGGLYKKLHERMERTYGMVLPDYGPNAVESVDKFDANYFVIGPEKQLDNYEKYLRSVESPDITIQKIYPRDFWQTTEGL